MGKKLK